jgi:signal peptidase I
MPEVRSQTHPSRDLREGWVWLCAQAVSLGYLVTLLVLAAIALLPLAFGGISASVVQSGSMSPLIVAGDVVLSQPYSADDPVPMGRVVTFPAAAGSAHPGIVLHRIVASRPDGALTTAGDANVDVDSDPLNREDIIGRAFLLVPKIGLPSYWLAHREFGPLAIWSIVSVAALAVQAFSFAHRPRRGKHNSMPVDPEEELARPSKATTVGAAAAAVALLGGLLTLALVAAPVTAGFSATAGTPGNTWSMSAAVIPNKVAFSLQPSGATGGSTLTVQPAVVIQGALGDATTSTAPVTLAITSPGGATLTCATNPMPAVSGTAQFAGCSIDRAGTYKLSATSPGLIAATSTSFTVTVGPATRLSFSAIPGPTARNTSFATQPTVGITDSGGNRVTSSAAAVTLSLTTPGGATLTCTTNPQTAVAGLASFTGCRVNQAGIYTLKATSPSLASAASTSFTIYGTSSQLVFTSAPGNTVSGDAFATQPVVAIQDATGFTTGSTASVSLAITTPAGATLTCTTNPRSAVAGVATFAGCSIGKAGTYTLRATSSGLTSATTTSFTVGAGPAARLSFSASPSNSVSSTPFSIQPVVRVLDTWGNIASSAAPVTIAITTPAGATLTCAANPVVATQGLATFSECAIAKAGTYTLTASSPGLGAGVSNTFTISAGTASRLDFTTSPGSSTSGVAFSVQPIVTVVDAAGNRVNTSSGVTLAITPPAGGAILTCSANPRTASAGTATFSGCRIDRAGNYTLVATAGTLTAATSTTFIVN